MPRGAPARKLAITVDQDVHVGVVRAAKAQNTSVSAWMTSAARRILAIEAGLAAEGEWQREHGQFTAKELKAARKRVLGVGAR